MTAAKKRSLVLVPDSAALDPGTAAWLRLELEMWPFWYLDLSFDKYLFLLTLNRFNHSIHNHPTSRIVALCCLTLERKDDRVFPHPQQLIGPRDSRDSNTTASDHHSTTNSPIKMGPPPSTYGTLRPKSGGAIEDIPKYVLPSPASIQPTSSTGKFCNELLDNTLSFMDSVSKTTLAFTCHNLGDYIGLHPRLQREERRQLANLLQMDASKQSRKNAAPGFIRLPNELLGHIGAHMNPLSKTTLALTCHEFRSQIGLRHRLLPDVRRDLLRLLEKDSSELLYCERCKRLFNWLDQTNRAGFQIRCSCTYLNPLGTTSYSRVRYWLADGSVLIMSDEVRNLVLRTAMYTHQRYGITPSMLAYSWERDQTEEWPIWGQRLQYPHALKRQFLIINNALFLRCKRRWDVIMRTDDNNTPHTLGYLHPTLGASFTQPELLIGLCQEEARTVRQAINCALSHRLPDVPQLPTCGGLCRSMFACGRCETDILITTILPKPCREGNKVQIFVTSWQNFGKRGDEPSVCYTWPVIGLWRSLKNDRSAMTRKLAVIFRDASEAEISEDRNFDNGLNDLSKPVFDDHPEGHLEGATLLESIIVQRYPQL